MEKLNVSICPDICCSYKGECEMKNTKQKALLCWYCVYRQPVNIPALLQKMRGEDE